MTTISKLGHSKLDDFYPIRKHTRWNSLCTSYHHGYDNSMIAWCNDYIGPMHSGWNLDCVDLKVPGESGGNYFIHNALNIFSFKNDCDLIGFKLRFSDDILSHNSILDQVIMKDGNMVYSPYIPVGAI